MGTRGGCREMECGDGAGMVQGVSRRTSQESSKNGISFQIASPEAQLGVESVTCFRSFLGGSPDRRGKCRV